MRIVINGHFSNTSSQRDAPQAVKSLVRLRFFQPSEGIEIRTMRGLKQCFPLAAGATWALELSWNTNTPAPNNCGRFWRNFRTEFLAPKVCIIVPSQRWTNWHKIRVDHTATVVRRVDHLFDFWLLSVLTLTKLRSACLCAAIWCSATVHKSLSIYDGMNFQFWSSIFDLVL